MSQLRHARIRPLAALLTVTLTSGTLAGLGILTTTAVAHAGNGPVCNQPVQTYASAADGSYTVPALATYVDVVASGAAGGSNIYNNGYGGTGATVTTRLSVTPGEVLDVSVGTAGGQDGGGQSGSAHSGGATGSYGYGGSGGGASFVTSGGTILVAAGGGGGAGWRADGGEAGPDNPTAASGVSNGGNGKLNIYYNGSLATGGNAVPGTGAPGDPDDSMSDGNEYWASPGQDGAGTVGGDAAFNSSAGGGGGGFKGGGGGAWNGDYPSAGGAGSSYSAAAYTIVGGSGNGSLSLSATTPPLFQSADSATFIEHQSNSFTVCAPGGPGTTLTSDGNLPAGVALTDNGDGTATVSGTPTEVGTFPLTFTSVSSNGTEHQTFSLLVKDITAKTLVVTASPTSLTAGGSVSGTVTALDAQGDVAATDEDQVLLSSADPLATFSPVTLVDGVGSFTAILSTAGAQKIHAADGDAVGDSNDVAVAPAAAASYTVVLPSTATAGDPVQAVITAVDQYGNVDTNDNGNVTLSRSDAQAAVSSTATLSAGTVTAPVTFVVAGDQQVSVVDPADSGVHGDSNQVTVSAGATTKLVESTPDNVTAGSTNWIYVESQDAFGNQTAATDTIHFTSTDPNAVLPADGTVNSMGAPEVTFKTSGTQTVTVTDITTPSVTSSSVSVTVSPGPVQTVDAHVGDHQSTPAGHDFGAPLTVLLTDANGNPVPNQAVFFSSPDSDLASFGGADMALAISNADGIATSPTLTAGGTVGDLTVNATSSNQLLVQCTSGCGPIQHSPISYGSTTFTETVTASDADVAATPKTSTGVGTATQSAHVVLPAGGTITLLDASGNPVTTVVTADGTYVLDPTTGVISFVAVAGFAGTATPVTYQVMDAYDFQADSTYTPTVTAPAPVVPPGNPVTPPPAPPVAPPVTHPVGVAHVIAASHIVLTGSTLSATCTVTVAAIKTCQTALTAQVSGRQVVIGKSSIVKAAAGAKKVKTVVHLTTLGRSLAAQVGGVKTTAWASVKKADGRVLSAKAAVTLVEKHVSVVTRVLFPTNVTALTSVAKHQLKALKAHLAAVKTITCVGYADTAGNAAANIALGKARAKAVCAALAGHGIKLVVVTHGDLHPAAGNNTPAGRTLNRRVEITLTY